MDVVLIVRSIRPLAPLNDLGSVVLSLLPFAFHECAYLQGQLDLQQLMCWAVYDSRLLG